MRKFRILSIDGGGIRGIVPALILMELEKQIEKVTKKRDIYISDYFDLITGNSTGGILACGLLATKDNKPMFKAKDILDLYLKQGKVIFEKTWFYKFRSKFGLGNAKFNKDNIENILKETFGDATLKDFAKPGLIPAYSLEDAKPYFFTNNKELGDSNNFYIRDVARATSAAPTFFEPAFVKSLEGFSRSFIDGGMFANNPSLCAYAEAGKIVPGITAKDMVVLSLGTGGVRFPYKYEDAKSWGLIGWALPVLNILLAANQDVVDYIMRKMFDTSIVKKANGIYTRIDETIDEESKAMDDVSEENLKRLVDFGTKLATKYSGELKTIAKAITSK